MNAVPADTHDQDLADGLENCVTKDGQNSPSANLPMNAKKHTGVADAAVATEYAAYGQLLALVSPFVGATNVGGTANAITLTPTPVRSLATRPARAFQLVFIETVNTGAVTLAVSGLGRCGTSEALRRYERLPRTIYSLAVTWLPSTTASDLSERTLRRQLTRRSRCPTFPTSRPARTTSGTFDADTHSQPCPCK